MGPVDIILILIAWVAIGVATALVMRRRGHDLSVDASIGAGV